MSYHLSDKSFLDMLARFISNEYYKELFDQAETEKAHFHAQLMISEHKYSALQFFKTNIALVETLNDELTLKANSLVESKLHIEREAELSSKLRDLKRKDKDTFSDELITLHEIVEVSEEGQIWGFPGDLSLGIAFPGDMSPGIGGTEKLEWDTFPSDILGRQRRSHIVSVKQLSATVEAFPGRDVARDAKIN
ncbi:hypothetical protein Tco_1172492 [Tanacetum coccineum]